MDIYSQVPKGAEENLAFRKQLIESAAGDKDLAQDLWVSCSRDFLFYVNAFCWTYDPRKPNGTVPFITWHYQDEMLLDLVDCIFTGKDVLIQKSRDMGASWIILLVFEWLWHFRQDLSFLLVSRNEDYVDKPGNPKSLFWKIDFIHKNQPKWLLPNMTRTKLRLTNDDFRSHIDGESTTGDVARGDRRTAIGLDEFAAFEADASYRALSSTRDATRCRIFNSTPAGTAGAFYDLTRNPDIKNVKLHWTLHPEKSKGLYEDDNGKKRSPWYDRECRRCAHPQEIAQELDIDFAASDYQFFDPLELNKIINRDCRKPFATGNLIFDEKTCVPSGFSVGKGPLSLWIHPDAAQKMPGDRRYAMGVDIATGTGASNSVISIGDCSTGEKIAELCTPHMRPDQLGRYAVALAKWFRGNDPGGAYLIWEAPGPGRNFGDVVLENNHRNIYYRTNEVSVSKKQSNIPGWWPTKDEKRSIYGEYRRALSNGLFINRSSPAVEECREIIFAQTGWITHSRSLTKMDPSGARENHGDRPTADALLWKAMSKYPPRTTQRTVIPENSLAFRRFNRETKQLVKETW
tara:strand:- start:909 stop:2630 length:1722 start_codon:yes stop_codon:yes gene_type:complete